MAKKAASTILLGRWRISGMTEWDDNFLDEESEAYIRFDADGGGAFHFGYVPAVVD